MSNWKQYLSSLYFNPKFPASYLGPEKRYQIVKSQDKYKIGRHRIRKWLQDQESYSLTIGARRRYTRSRVIVAGNDSQWDMDLMDMVDLAKQNDDHTYVLVAIDFFFPLCPMPTRQKQKRKRCPTGPLTCIIRNPKT